MRNCAVEIPERLERDAQARLGDRQRRVQPDGRAQLLDCRLEPSEALQRQPEIVPCLGVAGPQPDGGLKRRQRGVEIARPPARGSQVILRVEQGRVELDRARNAASASVV